MNIAQNKKGFTLVEIVIYLTIIASFLVTAVFFSLRIVESSQRGRVQLEVQQNARIGMERMMREIRAAQDLNTASSTFDTSPGVLSLEHTSAAKDPTVFDLSDGSLRIAQGSDGPFALTSNDVTVTNLEFTNLTGSSRSKTVRVDMTVKPAITAGGPTSEISFSLTSSGVIRVEED